MFNVIITGITSFLTDMASEMVYPLIPLYLSALGAPPAVLGVIEGFAESTASILKVFSGRVSDNCLLYTSPSPRDGLLSRMPSSA